MKTLRTQADIDNFVREGTQIGEVDYGAMINFFNDHRFEPSEKRPIDPDSAEYLSWQKNLWRLLSGRDEYQPQVDERDPNLTLEGSGADPFPFCTGDANTIGDYLGAIGLIVKALNLRRGARVVEFGVGWGHTTMALAQAGYDVTAVDIEPTFLEILDQRTKRNGCRINTRVAEFLDIEFDDASLDAVVFFECFHHCLGFRELVGRLSRALKPGGRIVFAGEPIYDWYDCPWGVRLDGHSVWSIRKFGWMELGFNDSYFENLLAGFGFELRRDVVEVFGSNGRVFTASLPS